MKKLLKSLVLLFVCVLGLVGLVACDNEPKEHQHSITNEWSKDATKHWHACSGCDELVDKEAHEWGQWIVDKPATETEKGSQHRTCKVCGYEGKEDIPMIPPTFGIATELTAVYAQVPADWDGAFIYYWSEAQAIEEGYTVGWPGVEMTLVDAKTRLYGYKVPKGTDSLIFNFGGVQTVDIKFAPAKNLYILDEINGTKYTIIYSNYTPKSTDPELASTTFQKVEKLDLYVQVPADWEKAAVHYWGSTQPGTDWPGVEMTVVDAEKKIFTYSIPKDVNGLIINEGVDGGRQTVNLELSEGVNAFVIKEADSTGKYLAAPSEYKDGTFTELEIEKTTPVFYVKGDMNDWSDNDAYKLNIDGDTATIELTLKAGVKFKVATSNWSPEFGFANFTGDKENFVEDEGNIKVVVEGTYIITVTDLNGTPACTITLKA